MSWQKFVKKEIQPFGWCPGCALYTLFYATAEVLDELRQENTVVVSGIGCSGRGAAYFNLDTVHGAHGRAIPLAVGVKTANPKLNVMVFSGDGDLLGIGGNHLLHSARRNDNLTVICYRNELFAMTGGQAGPTTRINETTVTSPQGNKFDSINVQGIITANQKYFYARTSTVFKDHLKQSLKQAIKHQGFSFVEVVFPCLTNYIKKTGKTLKEITDEVVGKYKISTKNKLLKNNELGIIQK